MTHELESLRTPPAHAATQDPQADERVWCLDCYDSREPWVVRTLEEHGVKFRPLVLESDATCRSCHAALQQGTHAVCVRYPWTDTLARASEARKGAR